MLFCVERKVRTPSYAEASEGRPLGVCLLMKFFVGVETVANGDQEQS